MPQIDEAIEALLAYQQADMEGTMVLTSRQAIHEVADELRRMRDDAQPVAWCGWHPKHGWALQTTGHDQQHAASLLMRTDIAGNHGWSVQPLYAAQPPAAPVETARSDGKTIGEFYGDPRAQCSAATARDTFLAVLKRYGSEPYTHIAIDAAWNAAAGTPDEPQTKGMREALEPFSKAAENYADCKDSRYIDEDATVTVGDLREARASLTLPRPERASSSAPDASIPAQPPRE